MPDSCDFTFAGRHIREFGAAFLPERWPGAAATSANDASVSGRDGTLRYPGQTYGEKTFTGRLYLLSPDGEPLSYASMLARAEAVCGWLKNAGRAPLVLDATPERVYMAEVKAALFFSTEEWPSGSAAVTFTLQPFAYAGSESFETLRLSAGQKRSASLYVPGNRPAPLLLTLEAGGPLTSFTLAGTGQLLCFEGLSLAAGQSLTVAAPLETGEIMTCQAGGESGMGRITAQSDVPFWLGPGLAEIQAEADGPALLRVGARGRWI